MKIGAGLEMLPAGQVPFPCLIQKPKYPLKQCYLFRNTSCTSAAPQVTPLFSETHSHCVTMTPKSPSFQFCSSGSREWYTHSCKEIYFQVSRKRCSSGFLFHLRLPSLGKTREWKKRVARSVCTGGSSAGTSCLHP